MLDLEEYLSESEVPGERIFGRHARDWRAEVFLELILNPIARAFPDVPPHQECRIGWRQTGAVCWRRALVPKAFLSPMDPEDLSEIARAVPGIREPVKVIDAFLDELVESRALRARPGRGVRGATDPSLKSVKVAFHSLDPGFVAAVQGMLRAHDRDRACILAGRVSPGGESVSCRA